MDYSVDSLHRIEKDLNAAFNLVIKTAKVDSVEELNHNALMKVNKDPLADCVEKLAKLLKTNIELCQSAAEKIDRLQSDNLQNQSKLIALQHCTKHCKNGNAIME